MASRVKARTVARDIEPRSREPESGSRDRAMRADGFLPLLLVVSGVAAYLNSFAGVFLLDDKLRIVSNPQIRHLWPPWSVMAGSARPILDLSFALNYSLGSSIRGAITLSISSFMSQPVSCSSASCGECSKAPVSWGAWFFLILAPTSSVMPIADLAFEHRMYLSLAAVVAVIVIGGHDLFRRIGRRLQVADRVRGGTEVALALVVVIALASTTHRRNEDYRSELGMWRDTVAKRSDNARAHLALGLMLKEQGKLPEAMVYYDRAIRLKPGYAEAHNNLGNALARGGDLPKPRPIS